MAGRRGGKTVWEVAELAFTCVGDKGRCGWFAPNFPVLRDAWRDIKTELAPLIHEIRESEWTINFRGGGMLECWSMDSGIVARSRKYHKVIIDEAGLIPNLAARYDAEIEPTLGDYDGCLVAGSTPNLVGPDFLKWFQLGQTPGSGWKSWRWSSLENPAVAEQMARRIEAARKRGVPEWVIRQEYFAEPSDSDTAFFSAAVVAQHRARFAREPMHRGTLDTEGDDPHLRDHWLSERKWEHVRWMEDPDRGAWRLWIEPVRPNQERSYVLCADLSMGVGSSNTVFVVYDAETKWKLAEYAWPGVTPDAAARLAVAAALWFGGRGGCCINYEVNGPGELFGQHLLRLGYRRIWLERQIGRTSLSVTDRYGWRSSQQAKETLLSEYRSALATDRIVNLSGLALDECLGYRIDKHGKLVSDAHASPLDEVARMPHGDRVIADALAVLTIRTIDRLEMHEPQPQEGSWAARHEGKDDDAERY